MSAKPFAFHKDAGLEVEAAFAWYMAHSRNAAVAFMDELEQALASIQDAPHRWPLFEGCFRRYLLRRFPFYIVYRETDQSIEVIALAHGRRRPGYWRVRTM